MASPPDLSIQPHSHCLGASSYVTMQDTCQQIKEIASKSPRLVRSTFQAHPSPDLPTILVDMAPSAVQHHSSPAVPNAMEPQLMYHRDVQRHASLEEQLSDYSQAIYEYTRQLWLQARRQAEAEAAARSKTQKPAAPSSQSPKGTPQPSHR
ncbi:hypothetical protein DL93DRAFT_2162613 [Clavulina sp. PMI_390]|nr:hypothetical protein DL93DRAFT_2162613 [Clavulina sp. PMI_390]